MFLVVRKASNLAKTPSPILLDIFRKQLHLQKSKRGQNFAMFALLTKACTPAVMQALWSWDLDDDPLSGPDGYSNGPGTGAVIAPPPYEGQQPSRIQGTNHGGSSFGAFTGDY